SFWGDGPLKLFAKPLALPETSRRHNPPQRQVHARPLRYLKQTQGGLFGFRPLRLFAAPPTVSKVWSGDDPRHEQRRLPQGVRLGRVGFLPAVGLDVGPVDLLMKRFPLLFGVRDDHKPSRRRPRELRRQLFQPVTPKPVPAFLAGDDAAAGRIAE